MAQKKPPHIAANDHERDAKTADAAEDYARARELYKHAINCLEHVLRYERHAGAANILRRRIIGLREREIELRDQGGPAAAGESDGGAPPASAAAATASRKGAPAKSAGGDRGGKGEKSGKSEEDEDEAARASVIGGAVLETRTTDTKFADVAGLAEAKRLLEQAVIFPVKQPALFEGGRRPWIGVLLFGPPGTGKSFLAEALANEAGCTFFAVSSSAIVTKWLGESEKLIKTLFAQARARRPAIIFIDEIDSLASARSESESESAKRIKTELLVQMNGTGTDNAGVLVLGATNTPWALDPAVRRRFEQRVYVPLPDAPAREAILRLGLRGSAHTLGDGDFAELAAALEGYSGSDISVVVRAALMAPINRAQVAEWFAPAPPPPDTEPGGTPQFTPCDRDAPGAVRLNWRDIAPNGIADMPIGRRDFADAMAANLPSVAPADITRHVDFMREFGREAQ